MAEVDRSGRTVSEVAGRHGTAETLLYNWRSHHVPAAACQRAASVHFIQRSAGRRCWCAGNSEAPDSIFNARTPVAYQVQSKFP